MDDFFDNSKFEHEREEHKRIIESQEYQQEIKFFNKILDDFILATTVISIYSSRCLEIWENSLLIRGFDGFLESAVATSLMIEQGAINPAKRELRYVLETSIKYLVVDQKIPYASYDEKVIYLNEKIPKASISPVDDILVLGLSNDELKEFKDDVNDLYKKLCKYVHPSKYQIDEYSKRCSRGAYIGFETGKEINEFNRLIFRIYEIIIITAFTSLGFSMTGDLFINVFDEKESWKFNKGKYVNKISHAYDYKVERKKKKHDDIITVCI